VEVQVVNGIVDHVKNGQSHEQDEGDVRHMLPGGIGEELDAHVGDEAAV
jgi:hypothetical protein